MNDLRHEILTGLHDRDLDILASAVRDRRKIVRQANNAVKFASFEPGDTVIFNSNASPKYLQGHEAEVVELKRTKIVVKLPFTVRKFQAGIPITTPVGIVDKLN